MVGRFRTPLKEAPVWNVLITSICKESESETALLHSQRGGGGEGARRRAGGHGRSWGRGRRWKARGSLTHKAVVGGRGNTPMAHHTSFKEQFAWSPNTQPESSLLSPFSP